MTIWVSTLAPACSRRGLLDRLGSVFSDTPTSGRLLVGAAEEKLRRAAAASDLRLQAEQNTRRMLDGMLRSLGSPT